MTKYEIMLILDPKTEITNINKFLLDIFKKDLTSFQRLDINELAYPINGQTIAIYVLAHVSTNDINTINEFQRLAKINKSIWRELIINLDKEVGLNKKPKPYRGRIPKYYLNKLKNKPITEEPKNKLVKDKEVIKSNSEQINE